MRVINFQDLSKIWNKMATKKQVFKIFFTLASEKFIYFLHFITKNLKEGRSEDLPEMENPDPHRNQEIQGYLERDICLNI